MVPVAYIRNFNILSVEFLLDFVFVIDTVFKEPAALDFPAIVDAATGGNAYAQDRAQGARGDNGKSCQNCGFHILKIEKTPGGARRSFV
jgi:hypothetical protein